MKIVHVQTVLTEQDLASLKTRTGEQTTKDALAKAAQHYLECRYVGSGIHQKG